MLKNMKKLFLISISFLPALMFAASFSPYLGDEDWGEQGAGSDFLQNFVNPDAGEDARPGDDGYEDESFDDYVGRLTDDDFQCPTCADADDYFICMEEIYDEGVLPVKDGEGNVIRYEFPGCTENSCPIHHVFGYAADDKGNISEVTPEALQDEIQKPRLPVGEPFVMLLFAGVYAIVRKRQNAVKA